MVYHLIILERKKQNHIHTKKKKERAIVVWQQTKIQSNTMLNTETLMLTKLHVHSNFPGQKQQTINNKYYLLERFHMESIEKTNARYMYCLKLQLNLPASRVINNIY